MTNQTHSSIQLPPMVIPQIQILPDSIAEILANNYDGALKWDKEIATHHPCKDTFVRQACDYLQGKSNIRPDCLEEVATHTADLMQFPEFGAYHALLLWIRKLHHGDWVISWDEIARFHPQSFRILELRQVIFLIEKAGLDKGFGGDELKRWIAGHYLSEGGSFLRSIIADDDKVYPFFAENLDFIKEALGLMPDKSNGSYWQFKPERGIEILHKFPSIPPEFIDPLFEFAFSTKKELRMPAQKTLERLPDIRERLLDALNHKKQQIRTIAKEWLTELDSRTDDITRQLPPAIMPTIEMLPDSIAYVFSEVYDKELKKHQDELNENPLDADYQAKYEYFLRRIKSKEVFVQETCDYLQGKGQTKPEYLDEIVKFNDEFNHNLMSFSKFGAYHALLLCIKGQYHHWYIEEYPLRKYYAKYFWHLELRQMFLLLEKIAIEKGLVFVSLGYLKHLIAREYLSEHIEWNYLPKIITDDDKIYPFFAENLQFIQRALGFLPDRHHSDRRAAVIFERGIEVLHKFPSIPQELIAPLFEVAFGRKQTRRLPAQQVLEKLPDLHERLFEVLNDKKPNIRIMAIQWLARLNDKSAIAPLTELLQKEKKQEVIDEIELALGQLGETK